MERRHVSHVHITKLVECRADYSTAVLIKERRHISSAAEERHAEWCFCNNHIFPSNLFLISSSLCSSNALSSLSLISFNTPRQSSPLNLSAALS